MIGQALHDDRFNKTSVQQNLNILVLLMSVRVVGYKNKIFDSKPTQAFICKIIFALVEEEDERNNEDNKDKTKIQLTFESLR